MFLISRGPLYHVRGYYPKVPPSIIVKGRWGDTTVECSIQPSTLGVARDTLTKSLGPFTYLLLLAGNEGMEESMETTIMRYAGTILRIHAFIPS